MAAVNEVGGTGDVHVYWSRPVERAGLVHLLDDIERGTYTTLHREVDRNRYVTAHALLRRVLARHTGISETEQRFHRRCVICGGPHGKPRLLSPGMDPSDLGAVAALDTPHVNLSYTGGRVLLALREEGAVGVDVEHWDATDFAGFNAAALTQAEARELLQFDIADRSAARTMWWARKEAVLKATGHGLRVEATSLRVSAPDRPPSLLDWTDDEVPRPEITLADVPIPGRYAAAVAVEGTPRDPLRLHVDEIRDLGPLLSP